MGEITIAIWVFVVLIVTNVFSVLLLVVLINGVCYIHDMLKVSIDMRKEAKNGKTKDKR